tara:strand:+ start:7763 stop:8089 length:327 start_codon:yes stop_codon:yes gene_type:complete
MKWIKEKWEVIATIVVSLLMLIGFLSTRKTKNEVGKKSAEIQRDAERKIAREQKSLTDDFLKDTQLLTSEKELVIKELADELAIEKEKLKNDSSLVDDKLDKLGLNKK